MTTVGESPMKGMTPSEMHDKIMHSVLTIDSIMIMGSDLTGDKGHIHAQQLLFALFVKVKKKLNPFSQNYQRADRLQLHLVKCSSEHMEILLINMAFPGFCGIAKVRKLYNKS